VPRCRTPAAPAIVASSLLVALPAAVGASTAPTPLLAMTAGEMNIKHPDEGPIDGGIEYRFAPLGRWKLVPGLGFTIAEAGVAYGYASLRRDFGIGEAWFVTPVFGAGLFRNGGDVDLNHVVEFKTGLEVTFRVAGRYRMGLLFYHLSNAGLSQPNPGTEVLELVFAVPLGRP
jgi:lipid A 3-O-deacylase